MNHYSVYMMEVDAKGMTCRACVELHHLCPSVVVKDCPEAVVLMNFAKEALSFQEGPKPKVDLIQMKLIHSVDG